MQNKTVLITGAAARIGAAIAECLHGDGMDVLIHYNQSATAALELEQRLNRIRPDSAMSVRADLLDDQAAEILLDAVKRFKGSLYALVNNASSFYPTRIGTTSSEQWDDLMGTNLKAPYFLVQALAASLRAQHGTIINIVDIHAQRPLPGHTVYCCAKAGLEMMTMAMARELAPHVRVNGVAPGAIIWPADMDTASRDGILGCIPLGTSGSPADVASTVRFLVNDAAYITGQIINVDGGRSVFS